ncbi:hypothetical protein [Magnetofaba australis]|uniref:Uncharacterized protein n=1 Tax=Magnetofaba australis IT-1 TaxID=1434232 RepID=A0A1Y2K3G7_9PROT|nr:hypothetical protein [Magnetofaba australis]OSM02217.1 hypothetical protein MAIT1_02322 [Magnetofaba australis IT-1]
MESIAIAYDELQSACVLSATDEEIEQARQSLMANGWSAGPVVALNLDGDLHALNQPALLSATRILANDFDYDGEYDVPLLIIGYEEAYNLCRDAGMSWDGFLALPTEGQAKILEAAGFVSCAEALRAA